MVGRGGAQLPSWVSPQVAARAGHLSPRLSYTGDGAQCWKKSLLPNIIATQRTSCQSLCDGEPLSPPLATIPFHSFRFHPILFSSAAELPLSRSVRLDKISPAGPATMVRNAAMLNPVESAVELQREQSEGGGRK